MRAHAFLVSFLVLLPSAARADRGALTVDGAAGLTVLNQPAPYANGASATPGSAVSVSLGARYALTNHWELFASGFFEPPVSYFHNGIAMSTPVGVFPGTLKEELTRFGGQVGVRRVWGLQLRLSVGLDLGWSRRASAKREAIDEQNPLAPVSYGLDLPDAVTDNLALSLVAGLEWQLDDHVSLAVMPRLHWLVGAESAVALTVPLVVSWSWYL